MHDELGELEREGDIVPLALNPDRGSDLVGRQSAALASAIDHLRDLRRFVSDSLEHLPDPMFVTDTAGTVTMANHRIEDYLGPVAKGTSHRPDRPQYSAPMMAFVRWTTTFP